MSPEIGVNRPHLSILALICFIISFLIARTFTTLNPTTWLITGGLHIHHFWYGLVLLVIGGWLAISYSSQRVDQLAAILFGLGGGILGDEVGLLLTFGDYWSELTYSFIVVLLIFTSILILLTQYSNIILKEFDEHLRHDIALYFGVFLSAISIVFILDSTNIITANILSLTIVMGCFLIFAYFTQRYRHKRPRQ
ncbi:MAG: hypothetical protein QG670_1960 [Thermoproteota archaeon]|nr:hypothetical protein [Thermoproteota archaeon]